MRYNKQTLLKEIGKKGQEKLSKSLIAVIGLGAIGSNSAALLARAGANLLLVDRDIVELENLQMQNLYSESDIGKEKAIAARNILRLVNSEIKINARVADLNFKSLNMLDKADLILDCTDNLETRFLINEYCLKNKKPWIYAGVIGTDAAMLSFNNKYCFNCIFKEPSENLETCDTIGLINTAASLIASIQVTEAIKIIARKEFSEELITCNIWDNELKKIKVARNKNCMTCAENFNYLNGKRGNSVIKMCGRNAYQINGSRLNLNKIKNSLHKSNYSVSNNEIIAFKDGRVIVKANSESRARSIYNRYFG